MVIIVLNKPCKYHKPLRAAEHIFWHFQNPCGKNLPQMCWGNLWWKWLVVADDVCMNKSCWKVYSPFLWMKCWSISLGPLERYKVRYSNSNAIHTTVFLVWMIVVHHGNAGMCREANNKDCGGSCNLLMSRTGWWICSISLNRFLHQQAAQ